MKYLQVKAKNKMSGEIGIYHVPTAYNMMQLFLAQYDILSVLKEYDAEF